MRIIFFGTPDFAVPSLRAVHESGEEIISVVTQPDKLKGRGHKLSQPPVKEYALSHGLPLLQPAGIRSDEFYTQLLSLSPDLIVVVAYGRIIPNRILELPKYGCINLHASLLPAYRGAAPIKWAIINGEKMTGVTIMYISEKLDTGDIILSRETEITDEDDAESLSRRLSETGAELLVSTVKNIKDGFVVRIPQTGDSNYAPVIKKEDGRIDWGLPARTIFNMARGMYPWPGAFGYLRGERVTLIKTRVVDDGSCSEPGEIVAVTGSELHVSTGKGILSILELKPEGKKAMSGGSFAHGRHIKEGMRFES